MDDTTPRTILSLAAALLDVAANEFGRHGCNDCDLAQRLSDDEAEKLARLYDVDNLGSEERRRAEPEQAHTADEMRRAHDFMLMHGCALALRAIAATPPAPRVAVGLVTPADMREAAARLCDAGVYADGGFRSDPALAAAIRALPIPEAPALPGIDLAAIEAAQDPWTVWRARDALCRSLRSVTASRDAWVRAAFSVACDGPDQLAARLAALVAERDAQRSAAEGWERQAHEVEGRYEGACEERERMRGAMGEARGHLETIAAQYEGCDLGSAIGRALAALTSAGQERAKRRLDHANDCALSPTAPCDCGLVPTPEEMATTLYGTSEGFSVGCLRDGAAAGIRADRARRGGR